MDDESLDSLSWCALVPPLVWVPHSRVDTFTLIPNKINYKNKNRPLCARSKYVTEYTAENLKNQTAIIHYSKIKVIDSNFK